MPRAFYAWLGSASLSALGDAALYFALGWVAAGLGPDTAGLVLTMVVLPRTLLLLAGGVAGDRFGPRRVLLVGHLLLCAITMMLAFGRPTASLLLATALAIGVVEAFCLPCAGAFPRMFVDDELLPRAMALRGSSNHLVSLVGGPVGGVLVGWIGFRGAAIADGVTFAVSAVVLAVVRPAYERPVARSGRLTIGPELRGMLAAVALMAASALPMASLCLPLLVRSYGDGPGTAGLLAGVTAVGGLAVTLVVARRGAIGRPAVTAATGSIVAAVGMAGLAAGWYPFALLHGIGIGLFTAHLAPLFAASSPRSHLTRLQSVLALAQAAPLLVSNNVVGYVASRAGVQAAVLCCAAGSAAAGILLAVRTVRRPGIRATLGA